jgi:hypothetical protein
MLQLVKEKPLVIPKVYMVKYSKNMNRLVVEIVGR